MVRDGVMPPAAGTPGEPLGNLTRTCFRIRAAEVNFDQTVMSRFFSES